MTLVDGSGQSYYSKKDEFIPKLTIDIIYKMANKTIFGILKSNRDQISIKTSTLLYFNEISCNLIINNVI